MPVLEMTGLSVSFPTVRGTWPIGMSVRMATRTPRWRWRGRVVEGRRQGLVEPVGKLLPSKGSNFPLMKGTARPRHAMPWLVPCRGRNVPAIESSIEPSNLSSKRPCPALLWCAALRRAACMHLRSIHARAQHAWTHGCVHARACMQGSTQRRTCTALTRAARTESCSMTKNKTKKKQNKEVFITRGTFYRPSFFFQGLSLAPCSLLHPRAW